MAEVINQVAVDDTAGRRVFVGNLSYKVDTEKLKEFFSSVKSEIVDAVAVKRFGRHAGYGFVTFAEESGADAAVLLKESELEGRKINVEKATPRDPNAPRRPTTSHHRGRGRSRRTEPYTGEFSKTTLFVGNLPFNVIDEDLNNIFAEFTVSRAHVVRRFNGASRGFGFVTLASEEEQNKAVEKLSDVWCDERKLIIRKAISDEAYKSTKDEEGIADDA